MVNNQIGFTTVPSQARSSPHPTDFAKSIGAPILHVNADDAEAVVQAFCIAAEWRAEFRRDVVVDLVGYRRRGHNELDGPSTTLPWSYNMIERHPTALEQYSRRLEAAGLASESKVKQMRVRAICKVPCPCFTIFHAYNFKMPKFRQSSLSMVQLVKAPTHGITIPESLQKYLMNRPCFALRLPP